MASTPSTDTLLAFQFLHRAGPHVGPSGHSQESSRRPMPITLWLRHQTGRVPAGEDSGTAQRTKARLPASPLQMFQVKNSPFRGPLAQNPNLRIKTKYLLCHQKNRVLREKMSRGLSLHHAEFAACSQADCSPFPSFFTIMFRAEVRMSRQSI